MKHTAFGAHNAIQAFKLRLIDFKYTATILSPCSEDKLAVSK